MITAEAAGLAIDIAGGLIKLTHRLDLVLAERAAAQGPLALVQPDMVLAPTPEQMIPALRALLDETAPAEGAPDPLGLDRPEITALVEAGEAGAAVDQGDLLFWMQKHLPRQALGRTLNLNSKVLKAVRSARPEWDLTDPAVRAAAFFISPGLDPERKGYTWRIALTVVDTLAELGAENAARFTRDERVQGVVRAVLERFAEADLQTARTWEGLVRKVLSATLNGALDARGQLEIDDAWVVGVLDALEAARAGVPEGKRDQFLLGLLEGQGYPALIGAVLDVAVQRLEPGEGQVFEAILEDVLAAAAEHFQQGGGLKQLLHDHWADVARAALGSLAEHGAVLLEDQSPLVQTVVGGVLERLAATPSHRLLTTDTLVGLIDAAVGAVAARPELIAEGLDEDWLELLVRSVAGAVADQGVVATFGRKGLETLLKDVLAEFAAHPETIVERPGLAQELVGGVLGRLKDLDRVSAETLAGAALGGSLEALAARPDLLRFDYAGLVVDLAGRVGILVDEGGLSRLQGADVLRAMVDTLLENPALFLEAERGLAACVVDAVVAASRGDHGALIAGATLVHVARSAAEALAASGRAALVDQTLDELAAGLQGVVDAGLARAQSELGNRLALSALPGVLGELIQLWARGELGVIDPENQNFKRLFSRLADQAAA